MGGGGTFAIGQEAAQSSRIILASGEVKSIQFQCNNTTMVIGRNEENRVKIEVRDNELSLIDKSLNTSSLNNYINQNVDATLLLRVSPHFNVNNNGSTCSIANESYAKPFTIPMRLRHSDNSTSLIQKEQTHGIIDHHNEDSLLLAHVPHIDEDTEDINVNDTSAIVVKSDDGREVSVINRHTQPVLQITPRQLLIVGNNT